MKKDLEWVAQKYEVITAVDESGVSTGQKLSKIVKEYIEHGWEPIGGVSITFNSVLQFYVASQAMVKKG